MGLNSAKSKSKPRPDHPHRKHHQRAPRNPTVDSTKKSFVSINATKAKIRNLQRTLEHSQETMPAGVRIEKERALVGYKQDLEQAVEERRRAELVGKYHKVRFFERRKAERALKRAKRAVALLESWIEEQRGNDGAAKLQDETEKVVTLRKKLHDAEVDVNYTVYYPLEEKYLSLFAAKNANVGNDADRFVEKDREKPPVWAVVERCMADGTMALLREGKLGIRSDGSVKAKPDSHQKMPANVKGGKKQVALGKNELDEAAEVGEDSEGGFFEE